MVFSNKFATEIDVKKQPLLQDEHDVPMLVADVKSYKDQYVRDITDGSLKGLPWTDLYIGGLSCTALSNTNSKRKSNKGAVSKTSTDTGETFDAMKYYVGKVSTYLFV